jgi:hypothetical protein
MKSVLITCIYFISIGLLNGQNLSMQTIYNSRCKVSAIIPSHYTTYIDTLGVVMYSSLTPDSLIGGQLFIYNNYSLDSNDVLIDYMKAYNETDTLKTIAKFMLAESKGVLIYFHISQNTSSQKSVDIGIRYPDMNTSFVSFARIFITGNRMILLNVFAQECYLSQLLIAKDECFTGLTYY